MWILILIYIFLETVDLKNEKKRRTLERIFKAIVCAPNDSAIGQKVKGL